MSAKTSWLIKTYASYVYALSTLYIHGNSEVNSTNYITDHAISPQITVPLLIYAVQTFLPSQTTSRLVMYYGYFQYYTCIQNTPLLVARSVSLRVARIWRAHMARTRFVPDFII